MPYFAVVIWASIGVLNEEFTKDNIPSSTSALTISILAITCILLALRITLVIFRQLKRPLH